MNIETDLFKNLERHLKENNLRGIALDIDETLSLSKQFYFGKKLELFGSPENLSVEELIIKYKSSHLVPYWNTPEVDKWSEEIVHSNEIHEEFPLIEGVDSAIKELSQIVPIVAYITARPESILEGTRRWVEKHQLPSAPILLRPRDLSNDEIDLWKSLVMEKLYPNIIGIVDDNIKLIENISKDYQGKIFLYGRIYKAEGNDLLKEMEKENIAIVCPEWTDVIREAKNYFKIID